MVSLHHQCDWIWSHLGDTLWEFWESSQRLTEGRPQVWWHHPSGSGAGLNKYGEREVSIAFLVLCFLVLLDTRHLSGTVPPPRLPPGLPWHYGPTTVWDQTASQVNPSPHMLPFVKHAVKTTRKLVTVFLKNHMKEKLTVSITKENLPERPRMVAYAFNPSIRRQR